jgi:hypothetical protein
VRSGDGGRRAWNGERGGEMMMMMMMMMMIVIVVGYGEILQYY